MKNKSFTYAKVAKAVLFILIVNCTTLSAQKPPIILDTAFLKCEYKTIYYIDTVILDKGIWMDDDFILQFGHRISKYYSKRTDAYERVMSDPKAKEAYNKELELLIKNSTNNGGTINIEPLARFSPLVIYNNYPQNKRTIHDAVFMDYYMFEDDNLPQQWTIIDDSVKNILDYECKKAICSYRGRNYEAWFAPDLPVNAGPWKFSGLPGLIMSIQDIKGQYTFEIKGLEKTKEPIEYIEYATRKYSDTDRITFLRTNAKMARIGLQRYLEANAPNATSTTDIRSTGGGAKYDLLERDY